MRGSVRVLYSEQGGRPPCFCFDSVVSTNLTAKDMLNAGGCPPAFAVSAEEQTAGRGRYDRKFLSRRGKGIYITYVRRIPRDTADASVYGAVSALAVRDVLKDFFDIECTLKWPNDVLCGGKKICGILPESVYAASGERYLLIGIGINVFYRADDFGELALSATSAVLQCKNNSIKFSIGENDSSVSDKMRTAVCDAVDRLCDRCDGGLRPVLEEYAAGLSTIGRRVGFRDVDGAARYGTACGVAEDGALLVDCGGEVRSVRWGEVTVQ